MSGWPGKYVIGLTGNIATGKSVVRRMLEHLGAYGIDADALAHRAIAKGSPGYQPVIEAFGNWVLGPDGQVDRLKLGRIVFDNPEALERLESIIHPLVSDAVNILIRRFEREIVVVEAIKLLESSLARRCDAIWVTYSPRELQIARLVQKRGLNEAVARQRIDSQPLQEIKVGAAKVIIRNTGLFEDIWQQVLAAWQRAFPDYVEAAQPPEALPGTMQVQRARPREAEEIAVLITRLSRGRRRLSRGDVMAAFGEKAFMLLKANGKPLGIVGWQVENLVARTDEVYLDSSLSPLDGLGAIMKEVERASRELQCEISLLFLPPEYMGRNDIFGALGYEQRPVHSLGVRAWEEAAQESMPAGSLLLFKQLRQDRVLRPV